MNELSPLSRVFPGMTSDVPESLTRAAVLILLAEDPGLAPVIRPADD